MRNTLGACQQLCWVASSVSEKEEGHDCQSGSGDAEIFRVVQVLWVALVVCDAIVSGCPDAAGLLCAIPAQECCCGVGALYLHVCREVHSQRVRQHQAKQPSTPKDALTLVLIVF